MSERCPSCGLPMVGEVCAGCAKIPGSCECEPLHPVDPLDAALGIPADTSDTAHEPVSENPGALTSEKDTPDTPDTVPEYELRDGGWLDGQDFPPLAYNVPGLMPAGLGIIAAPPKAGKSLLVLDWLLAAATGGQALGTLPVGPARDVLYLALEDGDRRLQDRCRQLLADGEPIPGHLRYILAVPPGQVLAVLRDALERYPGTRLVVLDTLGRIMPLPLQGETTYQRDYRVAVALKRIADERPGLTIVVIHHTRKAFADDFIDSISGTHGLAGAADTIIMLSRSRGKGEGTLRVTGRDVIEADYAVTFRDGAWSLDGDTLAEARASVRRRAEAGSLGDRSAEIIEFIRGRPSGAKAGDIEAKFGEDGTRYVRRLAKSGRVTRAKRGLYVVSEPSEVSEAQVSGPENPDTDQLPLSEVSEPGEDGEPPPGSPGGQASGEAGEGGTCNELHRSGGRGGHRRRPRRARLPRVAVAGARPRRRAARQPRRAHGAAAGELGGSACRRAGAGPGWRRRGPGRLPGFRRHPVTGGTAARDGWSARGGWHDPETEKRWWLLSLERRETGQAQQEMRARRLGVTVDELRARKAARLAELAADAEAAGLQPACGGTGDPDVIETVIRLPPLPPDERLPWEVCSMCIRTLHKRKGRRLEVRPNTFCCACCAGLRQDGPPEVLDQWLLDSRAYKRGMIVATYQVDPLGLAAAGTRGEVTRYLSDSEGGPLAVVTTPAIAAAQMVPVRTYFALARERGRGVF